MSQSRCQELWYQGPAEQSLCALVGDGVGWLLYLREPGDAGFSSRNPEYSGPADATIEFVLSNGQVDRYPASWMLPEPLIMQAVAYFRTEGLPAPFIAWHNDSGDGRAPGPMA